MQPLKTLYFSQSVCKLSLIQDYIVLMVNTYWHISALVFVWVCGQIKKKKKKMPV